ncbi:helix-turn-helix domain-containing protein [bacterium]|nr:helix-turn-helix domain-containing protein [bacterium]
MHTHDFFEFFLIVSGSLKHMWYPNKESLMEEGDLVFVCPDVKHGFGRNGNKSCYMINLAFSKEEMNQCLTYLRLNVSINIEQDKPIHLRLSITGKERLARHLQDLSVSEVHSLPHFRIALAEIIWQLHINFEKRLAPEIPVWIVELCSKMRQKENFTVGIQRMQALSNKSNEHLSRQFKKYMHESPSSFVNGLRLDYACSLLANTHEPIIAIAYDSGFNSLSYFNRLFTEKYKLSPSAYRKQESSESRKTIAMV